MNIWSLLVLCCGLAFLAPFSAFVTFALCSFRHSSAAASFSALCFHPAVCCLARHLHMSPAPLALELVCLLLSFQLVLPLFPCLLPGRFDPTFAGHARNVLATWRRLHQRASANCGLTAWLELLLRRQQCRTRADPHCLGP